MIKAISIGKENISKLSIFCDEKFLEQTIITRNKKSLLNFISEYIHIKFTNS
jgi:hypothetical protein